MSVEQPAAATNEGEDAAKPRLSRNAKIGAAAAGIGSAAIVAALLYASRTRKAESSHARGEPEDVATD